MLRRKFFYTSFLCVACFVQAVAQQKDSVLAEVRVSAAKFYTNTTSSLPVQVLNRKDLDQINAINVADAVKFFSGVLVKDYGGIGGLKTVSVRSLGANHTGVLYDGIMLNDAQGGQIDLGKYRMENIGQISLYNAQPPDILNTARAFSAASVLSLQSAGDAANAQPNKNNFSAGLNAGSFGFIQPFASAKIVLSDKWKAHAAAGYSSAKNNYPFSDYVDANKTTRRINSDIKTFNGETNLIYLNENKSSFTLKTFYYQADRGLPNGIILYNSFANERLANKDFFVQTSYKKNWRTHTSVFFNGKYSYQFSHYTRPPALETVKLYENIFHQYEYYVSGAIRQHLGNVFSASYATDFFYTKLNRTDAFITQSGFTFAYPTRNTLLNNLALKAAWQKAEVQFSLLHSMIHNQTKFDEVGKNLSRLSPTISAIIQPFAALPLRVRTFYKNIFRTPTFNDLYYTALGNTQLKPEITDQFNIGLSYFSGPSEWWQRASFNADFYYNNIKDKIVATPRENLFQWSMQNLGLVKINGLDLSAETLFQPLRQFSFSINGNYTYQQTLDKTDPQSAKYNHQIPYTPKHSGSFRLGADYRNFSIAYSMLFSSYRFTVGEELEQNYLPGWLVSDVNVRYRLTKNKNVLTLFMEANNIFNKQYDIVMYYPMPGIHFRTGIKIERNSN